MTIGDWIGENITDDERALQWFKDPDAEDRIVRAYRELLAGYEVNPAKVLKTTCMVEGTHPGIVKVHDINFFSTCAHHFLPFFGRIGISYLPGTRILGLGKFPRLVDAFSRRFQIQEHLVRDIAEEIVSSGEARAAYVISSARHMCMCSRGPSDPDVMTDTTYIAGDRRALEEYMFMI